MLSFKVLVYNCGDSNAMKHLECPQMEGSWQQQLLLLQTQNGSQRGAEVISPHSQLLT